MTIVIIGGVEMRCISNNYNLKKAAALYLMTLILFSIVFSVFVTTVGGTDTGWKSPTIEGDTYSEWTYPTYAYTSDNNRALPGTIETFNEQDYCGFNLYIPTGATINGIIVSVEGQKTGAYPDLGDLSLECSLTWNDFGGSTISKIQTWQYLLDEYKEFGSSSDAWGRTWSSSDFSNSNFRVYFKCLNGGLVDHVRVKVYYTEITNNPPDTSIDNIPNPAGSGDLATITGGSTDDTEVDVVHVQVHNDTDGTYWTSAIPTNRWVASESASSWHSASAVDGTFNEKDEDWTWTPTNNWVNGKQYTVKARAKDNQGEYDASPASDTFTYSSGNSAPTAKYLSGADSVQYGGKQYSFVTRHVDNDGASNIEYAYAAIGSSYNDIQFRCDPNSGSNPTVTVTQGSSFVSGVSASRSSTTNGWDITWTYTIDWDWTHDDQSDIDYYAYTTDDNGANSGWQLSNQNADYENNVIVKSVGFTLSDSAYSEDGNTVLTEGEWFRGGVQVKASGVICYEGALTVYPPSNACDVRLYANDIDSGKVDTNLGSNGEFETSFYTTLSTSRLDNDFDFEVQLESFVSGASGGSGGSNGINSAMDNEAPSAPTNVVCRPDSYTDTGENDDDTTIYLTWTNANDGSGSGISKDIDGHGTHYAEIGDITPDELANNDGQDTDTGIEGTITYYIWACDNVGNYGAVASDTITIEITSPSCIIEYDSSETTFTEGEILRIFADFTTAGSDMNENTIKIEIETQGNGDLSQTSMSRTDNAYWYYDWIIPDGTDENGIFTVKIYGEDNAGKSISPNPTIDSSKQIDNAVPTMDELVITTPSSVNEGESFQITVTAEGIPVEDVEITFAGETYNTAIDGTATLTAPSVDSDTNYLIIASKEGYISDSETITVLDEEVIIQLYGYITGIISDEQGLSIEDALVCILPSNGETHPQQCVFTNENGQYSFRTLLGTYTVYASKRGYNSNSTEVIVEEEKTSYVNLVLEKFLESVAEDETGILFDYVVSDEAKKGNAGAKIYAETEDIQIFTDNFDINIIDTTEDEISFTVSAPDGTKRKLVFIEASDKYFSDVTSFDQIIVEYDDTIIERKSLGYILDSDESKTDASYAVLKSVDEGSESTYYFLLEIPSFSEHTIVIYSSVPQEFGGITAILYNVFFIIIIALIVISITFVRVRR